MHVRVLAQQADDVEHRPAQLGVRPALVEAQRLEELLELLDVGEAPLRLPEIEELHRDARECHADDVVERLPGDLPRGDLLLEGLEQV